MFEVAGKFYVSDTTRAKGTVINGKFVKTRNRQSKCKDFYHYYKLFALRSICQIILPYVYIVLCIMGLRDETTIVTWVCNICPGNRIFATELWNRLQVNTMKE